MAACKLSIVLVVEFNVFFYFLMSHISFFKNVCLNIMSVQLIQDITFTFKFKKYHLKMKLHRIGTSCRRNKQFYFAGHCFVLKSQYEKEIICESKDVVFIK